MSTQEVARILTNTCLSQIPQGYFRSKLFATNSTSNILLAAASPLLSLLERLCVSPTLPDIKQARDNIEHELYAFNSRLSNEEYSKDYIAISHYLLYATIDELLGKNYLRLFGQNVDFQAFTPSSADNTGPQEQFFKIINFLKEHPLQYLDLIELSYYCLITGFEGKYHTEASGRQELDNLIEELHQLITDNRVHKNHQLFKEKHEVETKSRTYKPFIYMSTAIVFVLSLTYIGSNMLLEHKAKNVLYKSSEYAKMDN